MFVLQWGLQTHVTFLNGDAPGTIWCDQDDKLLKNSMDLQPAPQSNVCIVERALFLWQKKHLHITTRVDGVILRICRDTDYDKLAVVLQWGLQTHVTFLNGDAPGTIWCDQDDKLLKNSMDLQPVSELTVADAKRLGVFEGMKAPQSNVCIVERALFLWQEKTFAVLQWGLQTHVTFLNGDAPGTIWCDQDDKLLKNSMDLQPVSELTVADAKRLGVFEGMKAPQSNVCIVERALFLWQEKTFAVLQWGLQTHVTFLNGDAPGTIWCDQDDKLLKNSMDLQPVSELTVADAKRLGVFEGMKA
ncbi:hypothetical protein GN244_ATG17929 [Phytophthora infestans]|uniref:Uncharacterized protein n=1 Tax=Phytophthora infestans TaxID=4787 RepID=A0A833W542_PHYIN|nr:hypothetical protein GN244_ATG17929 [Phytophthora infestans]